MMDLFKNGYESKSSRKFKLVLKIIACVLICFAGALAGYWFAGGFSGEADSGISTEKEFQNYIDANIERLKIELDCIVEQNLEDMEYLKDVSDHVNRETAKLEKRLERIVEYKEVLLETDTVIDDINNNIDRFRPSSQ